MLLLAEETFEAYAKLGGHDIVTARLDNPFLLTKLTSGSAYFFPFVNQAIPFAIWCFVVAALLYWVYVRVNDTCFYRNIAYGLGILGLIVAMAFRTAFPHPGCVFLAACCVFFVLINLSWLLAVAAALKLPYFGVPEDKLVSQMEGVLRPVVLYGSAFVVTVLPCFFLGNFKFYLTALLGGQSALLIGIIACLVCLAGVCGNSVVPWVIHEDQPILGGGFMKDLPPIFRLTGEAGRTEIMVAGVAICAIYVCMLLVTQGSISGADIIGIIVVVSVCFGIVRAEMRKSMLDQATVDVHKRKGAWS